MKKRSIIIIVVLLIVAAAVVLIVTKPWDGTEPKPTETATAPVETQTAVIGDNKGDIGSDKGDGQGTDDPEPSSVPLPDDPDTFGYAEFHALSPEQKDEFLHSFADYEAFYNWYVAAQAAFEKEHPDIEIGPDGKIDLSKLTQ